MVDRQVFGEGRGPTRARSCESTVFGLCLSYCSLAICLCLAHRFAELCGFIFCICCMILIVCLAALSSLVLLRALPRPHVPGRFCVFRQVMSKTDFRLVVKVDLSACPSRRYGGFAL